MLPRSAWRAVLRTRNGYSPSLRCENLKQCATALSELHPAQHRNIVTQKFKEFPDINVCRQQYTQSSATKRSTFPYGTLTLARPFATKGSVEEKPKNEDTKDITKEDPFDAPTYNIPQKPVTFAEGASYSVLILAGLGVAIAAGYAVFKELVFEPKEYKVFNKALKRIQDDGQVKVRIGSPITGYGQESRNRAARQRIANKVFTDEDGVEHIQVGFYIRGPHGAGKVSAEMFKDKADKEWKYTYLIVQITQPYPSQLILESYIPSAAPTAS